MIASDVQTPSSPSSNKNLEWYFSQVKGTSDEDEISEPDIISTVEFNQDGELLATGDKGGRVVIFQRDSSGSVKKGAESNRSSDYNVYSTFQSHEPEFDYLKSLEIEEKINKIRWLNRRNQSHFLLSTNDKTVKLWKVSERLKQPVGFNLRDDEGAMYDAQMRPSKLLVPKWEEIQLMIEASPKKQVSKHQPN